MDQANSTTTQIDSSLKANLEYIKNRIGNSTDLVMRNIVADNHQQMNLTLIYIDGIVDSQTIQDYLLTALMDRKDSREGDDTHLITFLSDALLPVASIKKYRTYEELLQSLMSGETLIFIEGIGEALSADTKGGERRSIQQPESQVTIRGPRDGFTESLRTNTALVRRRIQNPDLWLETMKLGNVTNTDVAIMYLNGIADNNIIQELKKRLEKIELDSVLESGYIEQMIEDETKTTFPTIIHTERPDTVAGNLLEGRIAIFVEGTPFVLIVPAVFIQFFQSPEDYYSRPDIGTATRIIRLLSLVLALLAPSLYIAATTFHQEMIPTQLLFIIAAQREATPFPALFEALLMEITFEILREAGVRMPRAIGSTISIVGALVIGQAAVQAGIVSPAMVIIVSITAIANYAIPNVSMAISVRLLRFTFMFAAAFVGLYGIMLGVIVMFIHLSSLRSFGVPYLHPLAPLAPDAESDTILRWPIWKKRSGPLFTIARRNKVNKDEKNEA